MFVHLKKKYAYLYVQFHWFKLTSSLVGQKFNSEIIWGSSFHVLGSVWYEMNWIFPYAAPHPYPGEFNLVHMPLHWPGFSTPDNMLSCLEKISRVVELEQVRSETRSLLPNSKAISDHFVLLEPVLRDAVRDGQKKVEFTLIQCHTEIVSVAVQPCRLQQ